MTLPFWILPLQALLPVAFGLGLLLPIKALSHRRTAWIYSAVTSTLSLGLAVFLASRFNWSTPEITQLSATDLTGGHGNDIPWISKLGLQFSFGLNSISLLLLLLTALLMPIVVLGSLVEVKEDMRTFQFWLHMLEAALMGTFMARNAVFFYACFELTLIPLFFLISQYGHLNRLKAAKTFFLYTFTGSLLMLAGILYVAWYGFQHKLTQDGYNHPAWNFDIESLWAVGKQMPAKHQAWVFIAFIAGLGVKTPLWPFHTWLPLAHTEAPTAGSVDLAGLVLKLGPYGLLLIAIPMLPEGVRLLAPWLGGLAVIGVLAAALVSWVQTDAKKLVAYSSVSHMGFAILGLIALDSASIGGTGAMIYMLSHGIATGGLFLCLGMLYDRFHTRDLDRMGGLAKIMPVWAFFFGIFAFASVGLPGLSGFVGELLCMLGTFNGQYGCGPAWLPMLYASLAGLGVILAAMYMLRLMARVVFGELKLPHFIDTGEHGLVSKFDRDLSLREVCTVAPLALACLAIGLYPKPLLKVIEPTVKSLSADAIRIRDSHLKPTDGMSRPDAIDSGPMLGNE